MMLSYGIIHERQITQHLLFVFILGLPAIVVDYQGFIASFHLLPPRGLWVTEVQSPIMKGEI